MTYIWELSDWPKLHWQQAQLAGPLAAVRYRQGKLIGHMEALGFSLRAEAALQTLTLDVIKSSEIEGEMLNDGQVRSSIARHLGMDIAGLKPADRNVDGVVEMMLDATQNYDKPLTGERLFGWHAALFPTGYSGLRKIRVGIWRDDSEGPMRVASGAHGHESVHYEAPPASRIEREMQLFLEWFNGAEKTDPILRSCIAHLWFVTIHPFDDGNGRIGRALADMLLARSEQSTQRFYSMSAQIRDERDAYYGGLEKTQKDTLDVTDRLKWFIACLDKAFDKAEKTLSAVFRRHRFWEVYSVYRFNERQHRIISKLLENFEGKLTSSKYAKIAKCSQDTALRDIVELVKYGVLKKDPVGGRSTSYSLNDCPN